MKNRKKSRKKNKKAKAFKFIIVLFTIFLCFIIVSGIYLHVSLSKLSEGSESISGKNLRNKNSVNILVLGVDIGTPGSKSKNDPKRTDTIMLVHYNAESKAVDIISIPRDTLIKINGRNAKINAAHAVGNVTYSIQAVEDLLGIDIDYYGKIDYEGFRKLIDAIGGVDMKIVRDMDYDDFGQDLHIHFKKGETVHLDGKKAEQFFRWRKNNNGTGFAKGDLGRIENQHVFVSKVIDKLKSPRIIPRIPFILNTLPKCCHTNMQSGDIFKYAYAFTKSDNIQMHTLKGSTRYIRKTSYFIYNKNLNKDLLEKIKDKKIDNNVNNTNSNKDDFKISVLNGTNKNGLASNYKKYLNSKGYNNVSTDNGKPTDKTQIILSKKFSKKQAKYLQNQFKIYNYKYMKNSEKFDIIIVLGKDHSYIE